MRSYPSRRSWQRLLWPGLIALSLLAFLVFDRPLSADCDGLNDAIPVPEALAAAQAGKTQSIAVAGVVSAVFPGRQGLNGFFLQTPDTAEPAGIFVYAPDLSPSDWHALEPGRQIVVLARPDSWRDQPQLQRVDSISHCAELGVPVPQPLHLPAPEDRLHELHGTLVTLPQELVVTGNYQLGRFGSLKLSAENRLFRHQQTDDERLHRIVLDDGSYAMHPEPVPYLDAQGTRRVGDRVDEVTGVLVHAFDDWRLHPVADPRFVADNPRPEAPDLPPGLRVAAFNVENYFLTLGQRGAGTAEEFARQRDKLFAALQRQDADLLALVEVENRREALADLVDGINQRLPGEQHYRMLDGPEERGGDVIKVALIYRPAVLQALSSAETDNDPVHNRPPVLAAFRDRDSDRRLLVAAVHFKAKVGCPQTGDIDRGQGCWNQLRRAQAQALATAARAASEDHRIDDILLAGDFNSYAGEDPVRYLEEAGFINLVAEHLPPERQYSYVFRGESGTLDYIFASRDLAEAVTGAEVWHINADEPAFLGFDERGGTSAASRGQPWRSSDHDPIVIGIRRDPVAAEAE